MLLVSLSAFAQDLPEVDAQLFRQSVDSERMLWVDDSGVARRGVTAYGRASGNLIEAPLSLFEPTEDGWERLDIVTRAVELDLIGAVSWRRVRVGAHLPVFALAESDLAGVGGGGLGDAAVDGRFSFLWRESSPVGLAVAGTVDLPTATVALPLANPKDRVTAELRVIMDREFGPVLLAANLGTRWSPDVSLTNVRLGDQLIGRLGASYSVTDATSLSSELAGAFTYRPGEATTHGAGTPIELLVGAHHRLRETLLIQGGVGVGLSRGIGAPMARGVASLAWTPARPPSIGLADAPDEELVENVEIAPGLDDVAEELPEATPSLLHQDSISLAAAVLFETARDVVRFEAFGLLDEIAQTLVDHPEIELIRIEGHADRRGSKSYNLDLSERRADAVRARLIGQGVQTDRLIAVGVGEAIPVDRGDSPEALAKNRRVVLSVERRAP